MALLALHNQTAFHPSFFLLQKSVYPATLLKYLLQTHFVGSDRIFFAYVNDVRLELFGNTKKEKVSDCAKRPLKKLKVSLPTTSAFFARIIETIIWRAQNLFESLPANFPVTSSAVARKQLFDLKFNNCTFKSWPLIWFAVIRFIFCDWLYV